MPRERRIIGIDPGYDRCGIAIIEGKAQSPRVVFSCCIETDKRKTFEQRIEFIFKCLQEIMLEHMPTEGSLEDIYFSKNQKTAIKVAEARGVCLLSLQLNKLKIAEYTPIQVKTYLTGYGGADKKQVYFMVEKIFKLTKEDLKEWSKKKDDEIDAIAIALTHLFVSR